MSVCYRCGEATVLIHLRNRTAVRAWDGLDPEDLSWDMAGTSSVMRRCPRCDSSEIEAGRARLAEVAEIGECAVSEFIEELSCREESSTP